MRYAPGTATLHCPQCGHDAPIVPAPRSAATEELDFDSARRGTVPEAHAEVTRVTPCPSCGAQVDFPAGEHAARCPYCDTAVVADTGLSRHIKPRGVLPFAIDEGAARQAMRDWLGSLWFAPNGLRDYARKGRQLNGLYVPFWTFDAQTRSAYTGERGDDYYVTRTITRDGKRQTVQERRTRWRNVRGRVQRFFDDVLILATPSLPKAHTDALAPWDLSELAAYRPEYLAGFMAESYRIELEEGFAEARAVMDRTIAQDVRRDIGGDHQRIASVQTQVSDVTFKHVLLPVWTAAYRYKGRSFQFVVNARTGKVQGERPYSKWKIALAVIAALIVAGIAALVYGQT
ncbi:primosomal protein N' (replication factor Y) - superfamily II helicase [Pseudoroseicyclus aestuarii]|nr:primosomal protein N' (replication factor Y) - superfamily II helicase [Pseudoroseicyclus aestuarii]